MRHVLGLASSRSALSPLKPAFPPYRTSLFTPRSLSTSSLRPTNTDQVFPKIQETVSNSRIKQAEHLPSTKVTDTAALGQETQGPSPALYQEAPASVKDSPESLPPSKSAPNLDPEANYTVTFPPITFKIKEKEWTILKPAFLSIDHYQRRNSYFEKNMHSYIQFITTPTSDTPGTGLVLHFDERRYIIGNVHEGLQRASLHTGARVFRTKDIFLTGKTEWHSNGGLLGMILSIIDATVTSIESKTEAARLKFKKRISREDLRMKDTRNVKPDTGRSQATMPNKSLYVEDDPTMRIHGGPNLTHTLATARSFIFRKSMPIKVLEHTTDKETIDKVEREWDPTWSDQRIQVWAMPIKPSNASELPEGPKSESPRKRSLGEYMSGECPSQAEILNQWSLHQTSPEGQDEQNRRIREFAVSEMFSSEWTHDNLIETPLRDVRMPAHIFIRDQVTKELTRYEGPAPDGTAPMPDVNVFVRQAWPGALIDHLPPTKRSSTAMSYIIRNHKTRGKFLTAAAKERNVPEGPLWAALASGSSVQSSDGVTVTPDMVLGPGKEGSGVAVIDLPSSEYVHDLVSRPEWRAARVMSGVVAVVWILGPGVIQDKTLLKFIEGQPGVQHIISSPEQCPNYISMTSAASMAIRHHQIDPARYAIPVHSNAISPTSGEQSEAGKTSSNPLFDFCQPAKRGLKIRLDPKFEITEEAVVPILNTALVVQETSRDILKLSQAARKDISSPAVQEEALIQNLPSPDAEIICLGTGSSLPSAHRNVSATLLRVPSCGSYLMDCGENTLGQLKRMYTAPQLAEIFQDLKLIWISHLHADHHLGLTSVIRAWYEEVHGKDEVKRRRPTISEQMLEPAKVLEDGKRLFIVGHSHMMRWLEEYSSVEDFGFDQLVPLVSFPVDLRSFDNGNLEWNGNNVGFNNAKDPKIKSAIRKATGLSNLVSCCVSHCFGAMAVSLTFPTGFKFSYSGDCRPSKRFAEIGKHSTVLLHEATFDDELKSEAIAKKHSTTSEAIGVGVAMGARRVILTHFSQRYQSIPSMSALDPRSVVLEDAEDIDDPSAGMDEPVEESTSTIEPQAVIEDVLQSQSNKSKPSQAHTEPQPQMQPSASPTSALAQIIASNINPTPRPQLNDMKIGVAFDYMRVKVGDIMHLDKFTPALMQLHKELEDGSIDNKIVKETPPDGGNDVLKKEEVGKEKKRSKEEQVEKARKGQVKAAKKQQERKMKWEKGKREESVERKGEDGIEVVEPVVETMRAVQ